MLSSLVLCVTLTAHAAELRVEGEIPFQLSLNGVTAAKLYGAGELTLRGLPAADARVRGDHGDGKIAESGSPKDIFEHPQCARLQDFLAKVL